MGVYDLQQVLQMWEEEKLTAEQAIGQTLLHIQALTERVGILERYAINMRTVPGRWRARGLASGIRDEEE